MKDELGDMDEIDFKLKKEASDRRDCFTMAALERATDPWDDEKPEVIAARAVMIADAVIKYLDEHPVC